MAGIQNFQQPHMLVISSWNILYDRSASLPTEINEV